MDQFWIINHRRDFMRTAQLIITVLAAACFVGCSKKNSPQAQSSALTDPAQFAAFTTNSLDVLQARYQEDEKQIDEALTKLDALRLKYGITDASPPNSTKQIKMGRWWELRSSPIGMRSKKLIR